MPTPQRAGRFWMMDTPPTAAPPPAGVRFAPVGAEAAASVAEAFGEAAGHEFSARLATGRRAYAAWVDESLAALGWASFAPEYIGEQGLWVRLRPGEAYLWDCVTAPPSVGSACIADC